MAGVVTKVRERAVAFGPGGSLVGVLTARVPPSSTDRSMVVMLNAGLIHRVGANRVHVRLGRALASAGHTVFRFDLSGIGDSDPRQDALDLDGAARQDIAAALEYLHTTREAPSFTLYGLCSGATNAFRYAVRDDRVKAAVLVDPGAFPTLGHRVRFYGRRLVRPRVWWNVLSGRNPVVVDAVRRVVGGRPAEAAVDVEGPLGLSRDEMRAGLRALIARGTDLLVVYTGYLEEVYSYAGQFRAMFPEEARSRRIRVEFYGKSDHTFSGEAQKQWLIDLVTQWIGTRSGQETGEPTPVRTTRTASESLPNSSRTN